MTYASVVTLFDQAATDFPTNIAIAAPAQQVTYGELAAQSNNLANVLLAAGAAKGAIVAILADDIPTVIPAILGILKAGGVFVPMDPAHPEKRLETMFEEVAPDWFVVQAEPFQRLADLIARVAPTAGILCTELGTTGANVRQLPQSGDGFDPRPPQVDLEPDDMCYIYFTSGSTGKPKGIAGRRKGLDHFVRWEIKTFAVTAGTRVSQFTTPSFDPFLRDIFVPLCAGGTVCVPDKRETLLDARKLVEWIDRQGINLMHCVPTLFRSLFFAWLRADHFPALRHILLAGEPLLPVDVKRWTEIFGARVQLVNLLGPTETTLAKFCYLVQPTDSNRRSIPIGKPIPGAAAMIMDAKGNPCPPGAIGEIYIRTPYRSLGYYKQPELTAEVFIQNPFTSDPNDIVYKTGDLGRVLEDGNFEFLGRKDHQVKIRGMRIELVEIENLLRDHRALKDVVVVDRDDDEGNKYLCAYIVPHNEVAPSTIESSALAAHLAQYLPPYMVPGAYVVMDELPRNLNGKINRRALPTPEQARGALRGGHDDGYVAPRTPVEELVADIWRRVLHLQRVSIHDGFFALGGHSLLATQVLARVRDRFEVEIPLRIFFDQPTVAGIAAQIEQAKRQGNLPVAPPIQRMARPAAGEGLPLSFAQQRLWFLHQMEPESPFYNLFFSVQLHGALNQEALEQTLSAMMQRHEILRTTFPLVDGKPVQMIHPAAPVSLTPVDLSALSEAARAAQIAQLTATAAGQPFDLVQGPLFRVQLLRTGEDEHLLLLTMHHIISDGWSSEVLLREIAALYPAFATDQPHLTETCLPALPVQYADFAQWQRAWLQGEVLEQQLAYWRQKLGSNPPVLQLPMDRPRPAIQRYRGARHPIHLHPELAEALRTLSRQEDSTLFITLLAAFQSLLHRYSGQDDIIVGSPVANRTRTEVEGLVGFFVNALILRTDFADTPTFRELLVRVREVVLEAVAHQDLPFEKLVDELAPVRDLSRTPLFQTVFVLQNAPQQSLAIPGLTLTLQEMDGETAKFDLTLALSETEQGLTGAIEYNTDLFDAGTIQRMGEHFQLLLESLVANLDQRIVDVGLLTPTERRQLLTEWNQGERVYPKKRCLHHWFEAEVERTPTAVAVTFAEESLTYRELNNLANQLAHHLQAQGVGPNDLVGIYMERSSELIVAILGVLKAGAAYVPLDPAYPRERLAFMLADSKAPVLLTQQGMVDALMAEDTSVLGTPLGTSTRALNHGTHQNGHGGLVEFLATDCQVICLDSDWDQIAAAPVDNPNAHITPDALAYVIYTSGSTGKPKGVMVTHYNVVRLFQATQDWYAFTDRDVWTLFHSYAFDFSVWEIWGALLYGGRLVVVPYWTSRSPADFYNLLVQEGVTVLNQTPSAFRQLIRAESEWDKATRSEEEKQTAALTQSPSHPVTRSPLALRLVIFGGEALELQSLRPWFARHGDQHPQLVNMYGITETTVHVTYRPITLADLATAESAAPGSVIGQAIPDLQIYILDQQQQPVPIGVPGELYVGGAGVAHGYLNRPELTDARFLRLAFGLADDAATQTQNSKLKTQKFYRTGDLARYLANGDIEYLGRIDHQVKIRGFRIELGEIESTLAQHPAVREVVVLARADASRADAAENAGPRLVAYVVPDPAAQPTANELRDFVKPQLPEYMIPVAFVLLDALPLTSNGKVDRQALLVPEAERGVDDTFVAPQSPAEQRLAAIWAQVLGVNQVGVHDNFFALGGDSILSIQAVNKANQQGLHITPKQLFQYPTIAELAAVAAVTPTVQAEQGLVTGTAPLTPIQHWFFQQALAAPNHWNQALLLATRTALDPALLQQAVQQLLRHHDALRLRFAGKAHGWEQWFAEVAETTPFTYEDLSALPSTERTTVLEKTAVALQASLDLATGPLLRVAFFDYGQGEAGRLLIVIHHLVIDGVSWRILLEDLQTAYQQLTQGETVQLPAKSSSYQAWAKQLTAYAQSAAIGAEAAYWLDPVRSAVAPLPVDYPEHETANREASTRTVAVTLSREETTALLQQAPVAYQTQINDLLLTALAQAFAQWTGERKLLVNLEGHGREDLFTELDVHPLEEVSVMNVNRTVGWFTAIYPVLLDLGRHANTPGALIKAVKEQLRRVPNRGVGYGLLRYLRLDSAVAETLAEQPQAEVSFNYFGQLDQILPAGSPLAPAHDAIGPLRDGENLRRHLLDINASVIDGQLRLDWSYSENLHRPATIERLAQDYLAALQALIAHCLTPAVGGYTPSDFPLARLEQWKLDQIAGNGRTIEDLYPLSPMQEAMLLQSLRAPDAGAYIIQIICQLGKLQVPALEQAWQAVVKGHPILRTAFVWQNLNAPLQLVQRQVELAMHQGDWRGLPDAAQQERLATYLQADRRRGFTLDTPPLMRLALFQVADDRHQLVWTSHHLLLDGWAVRLLLREFLHYYDAYRQQQAPPLVQSRPYRDYIAWLQQQDLAKAEIFWRQMLNGVKTPTPLGIGQETGSSSENGLYGGEQQQRLSTATTNALQTFVRQHNLTLNTLVQGAWALLLSYYSGEDDVVFGATTAGRPVDLPDADAMIGIFINTLPVRVRVTPKQRLLPWLQALQQEQVDLRQYEYTSLAQVQAWRAASGGRPGSLVRDLPLFESIVVFENFPEVMTQVDETAHGLQLLRMDSVIRNDLPFTVRGVPGEQLALDILYDQTRFDAATVTAVLQQMEQLLQAMSAQSEAPLATLHALLREADQAQRTAEATAFKDRRRQELQTLRRRAVSVAS